MFQNSACSRSDSARVTLRLTPDSRSWNNFTRVSIKSYSKGGWCVYERWTGSRANYRLRRGRARGSPRCSPLLASALRGMTNGRPLGRFRGHSAVLLLPRVARKKLITISGRRAMLKPPSSSVVASSAAWANRAGVHFRERHRATFIALLGGYRRAREVRWKLFSNYQTWRSKCAWVVVE